MNISLMSSFFSSGQNQTSTDLFGNLPSSLSDYAMIRSGSYGKLMRAYYKTMTENETSASKTQDKDRTEKDKLLEQLNTSTTTASAKALAETKSNAKELENAAEALQDKTLYQQKTITESDGTKKQGYDMAGLYQKVSTFVKNYNQTLENTKESDINVIQVVGRSMQTLTQTKQAELETIGISVGEDQKLKLDETAFQKADIADVKKVFQEKNSYGDKINSLASSLESNASYEASKANTYTTSGRYSANYTEGSLYQSWI
ncbi:MAG: hypothetical protein ACI4HI_12850 [Lachnospiraceae bacterium]